MNKSTVFACGCERDNGTARYRLCVNHEVLIADQHRRWEMAYKKGQELMREKIQFNFIGMVGDPLLGDGATKHPHFKVVNDQLEEWMR